MRILRVVVVTWLLTACGVALGWVGGAVFSRQAGFLAAVTLGTLAILLAIRIATTNGWLRLDRRRGGSIGGLCGFAVAAPLAKMNLDKPLLALTFIVIVGITVVLGAGPAATRAHDPMQPED